MAEESAASASTLELHELLAASGSSVEALQAELRRLQQEVGREVVGRCGGQEGRGGRGRLGLAGAAPAATSREAYRQCLWL